MNINENYYQVNLVYNLENELNDNSNTQYIDKLIIKRQKQIM